jgi:hypothetical protein
MKIPFATKIRDCLRFVADHPWAASRIGNIPYQGNSFLVNSKILAAFLGIKLNSCNRNFQQHLFRCDMNYQITQETRQRYPDIAISPRTGPMRRFAHGWFNEQSSDADVALVTETASRIRLQRGAKGVKETKSRGPTTDGVSMNDDVEFPRQNHPDANEFWFQGDEFMPFD